MFYDLILYKKKIIFLRYLTSNEIIDEILDHCIVINNPDEFEHFLTNILNYKNNFKQEINNTNYFEILEHWKSIL